MRGLNGATVRIIGQTGYPELPIGALAEVWGYELAYVVGHGLDQQKIGVKVDLGNERIVSIPLCLVQELSPAEAKRARSEAKKQRSRERRGLA